MRPMRIRQRFQLLLPIKIWVRRIMCGIGFPPRQRRTVVAEETTTENISSTGCYVLLSHEPEVGSRVRMEIEMPSKEGAPAGKVFCRGIVVRVEKNTSDGKVGVACRIDQYRMASAQPPRAFHTGSDLLYQTRRRASSLRNART